MQTIPVIVGFGGVNAAGRTSGHHAYRRTIVESLDAERTSAMWRSLAGLVGHEGPLDAEAIERLAASSLVRTLEPQAFDPDLAPWNRRVRLTNTDGPVRFELASRELPKHLPDGWRVAERNGTRVEVEIADGCDILVPDSRDIGVGAAGMVPLGFDPKAHYAARSPHPWARGAHLPAARPAWRRRRDRRGDRGPAGGWLRARPRRIAARPAGGVARAAPGLRGA